MNKASVIILKILFLVAVIGVYLCTQIFVSTIYVLFYSFVVSFKTRLMMNSFNPDTLESISEQVLTALMNNMNLIIIISFIISMILLLIIARARYKPEYRYTQQALFPTEYSPIAVEKKPYSGLNRMIFDHFRFKKIGLNDILILIITGISMQFVTITLLNVLQRTNKLNDAFEKYEDLMKNYDGGNVFFAIIALAVAAPIIEEVICRGFFRVEMRGSNKILYVLISSFAFGVMHMNLLQFIYAFALGILLAIAYILIDSIWAPIILHSAVNLTSVILSRFPQYFNISEITFTVIQGVSFIIVLFVFVYYFNLNKRNNDPDYMPE